MNANLKHMLEGNERLPPHTEAIIRTSFRFFRNDVDSLALSPQRSCWAVYFARRHDYLGQAYAGEAGARGEDAGITPGDIAVEQQRRQPPRRRRIIRIEE
jgi:hypothetical protein